MLINYEKDQTTMEKLKELQNALQEMNNRLRTEGKEALREAFLSIFEEYGKLSKIRWTQYTPYFNDGDPCVFSLGDPEVGFVDSDDVIPTWDVDRVYPHLKPMCAKIENIFKICPEEVFEIAFGDDKIVTFTREGFAEDSYDGHY